MIIQAYEYDLPQAFPSIILDILKIDLPQLKQIKHNKQARSIFIGKLFKHNPDLYKTVKFICDTIIQCYQNQLDETDVLLTKTDGFISTKPLQDLSCCLLPIKLKYRYQMLLFEETKKQYVGLTYNNECIIKGVPYKTLTITCFWKKILLNFTLPFIQKCINEYFTTDDLSLFAIPIYNYKEDKTTYKFILKNSDIVELENYSGLLLDIDRQFYYSIHVLPFVRLVLEDTFKT